MTRKDYVLIAEALKKARPTPSDYNSAHVQFRADVTLIADALANDNPRFDRERFLKACGVQS